MSKSCFGRTDCVLFLLHEPYVRYGVASRATEVMEMFDRTSAFFVCRGLRPVSDEAPGPCYVSRHQGVNNTTHSDGC